ncbi:ribose ABC transporter substrate-binding protein RbsB [Chitinibacter fontanus]|uniref:Ribose ABC transporter substrate-binding protein RbsB n=1 Tax=Chitinibacter fontanus TaxID=1737446 RepID=A0A7D5V9Y2_9NEIS|nr:ribose ABC transporter substrate-binding protein RbsB [Chitinibacter fontanus]QLI81716.1 ribose ABC transporter substrate-binding protein RbsB [Chitinibacter fontanus]
MKRVLSPLLIGLLATGLIACSKQGPDTQVAVEPTAVAGQLSVGLAISTQNNPFFVALRDGADAEAKAQGVKLITVDAQDDSAKQISNIEDLIQKKVQVILINPADSDAVAGVVKEAVKAGIKVVSLDRSVNGAEVSAHIASDNVAGGKMAAEFLMEKIGGKGNIVELEGIPGSSAARERGQGFHAIVDGKADLKLVAKQAADFDRAKGLSVMENILQGNKDVKGVFAHNDEMALGAFKAIEAAGLKNVVVVGFDATPDAVKAVKAGQLAATVQQKPELIGKMGVDTAIKLGKGEAVDKFIPVPLDLVKQ